MLHLPDVTLIAVDTAYHTLTRWALEACMDKVDFADVLVFTDSHEAVPIAAWQCPVEPFDSIDAVWHYLWYEVPHHIKTSHYLIVQWDGWLYKPECWDDSFLEYDYIGAPWVGEPGVDVGNGGFSLRSMKLAKILMEDRNLFPLKHPEDTHICQIYRPFLERRGIKFADFDTALRFSFECKILAEDKNHFGFHAIRNWPFILTEEEIRERLEAANGYVKKHDLEHMDMIGNFIKELGFEFGYMAR